jgi:SAM-dependent methyltransferase
LNRISDHEDAYGHLIFDFLRGHKCREVVERDDGYLDPSENLPASYFCEFRKWMPRERKAMRFVRGRALDVGCGAGRVALYLQQRGLEVVGIDVSPLALRVCRLRGVKDVRLMPIAQVTSKLGRFDTIVMFGNNFGLFANPKMARRLLKQFYKITSDRARIIAESTDPYRTKNPAHQEYHWFNRRRGRPPGQVRIRVRYGLRVTPWFDYLFVSKKELRNLIRGTGWRVQKFLGSRGPTYIAVLGKH